MASRRLANRYEVIERLGRGGMGVVYKAHDPVLDRTVAVKTMIADLGSDGDLRKRFMVEARAAARLNHPNIISLYELEEFDGELHIVMEYLEGVDLASMLRKPSALPLDVMLRLTADVCDGLQFAHEREVLHRDVKPDNLHLCTDGRVKIVDFGLARLVSVSMTQTGMIVGTPGYMAPEMIRGQAVDARADLFSLGVVLYELLAGDRPFRGDTTPTLLLQIADTPHVTLSNTPGVNPAVAQLVDRLLAKRPDERPSSAKDVRDAIRRIAAEASIDLESEATRANVGRLASEEFARRAEEIAQQTVVVSDHRTPGPTATPSDQRLVALAIKQSRTLREAGNLAAAMETIRGVLEVQPSNQEAIGELKALEDNLRLVTPTRRSDVPTRAVEAPPPTQAPSPPPVQAAEPQPRRSHFRFALIPLLMVVIAGIGLWMLGGPDGRPDREVASDTRPAPEPKESEPPPAAAVPAPAPAQGPAAQLPQAGPPDEAKQREDQAAKDRADEARLRLGRLKRIAADREFATHAPDVKKDIDERENEADSYYAEGSWPIAADLYQDTFERLQKGLESLQEADWQASGAVPENPPARPGLRPPARPGPRPRPLPDANPDIERQVRAIVDEYRLAIETRDVSLYHTLRGGYARPPEILALQGLFTGRVKQSVAIDNVRVRGDMQLAQATFRRTLEQTQPTGEVTRREDPVTMYLVHLPSGWIIREII